MAPFVTEITPHQIEKLRADLLSQGFELALREHTHFFAQKPGISCALYLSGKLVVQGSKSPEWIDFYLEPEITKRVMRVARSDWHENFKDHLGSDEAGKGDLFGPLCLACVGVEEKDLEWIHSAGVKDSKLITDTQIRPLARELWKKLPCQLHVVLPESYNKLWSRFKNLNLLMGWLHSELIEKLAKSSEKKWSYALVDQFSQGQLVKQRMKKTMPDFQVEERTKAESDPAVACASILARASFLKSLEDLSKEAGFRIPKGSGSLAKQKLREMIKEHPHLDLNRFVKVHFKTVKEVQEEN